MSGDHNMHQKPDPMELVRDLEKFATSATERQLAKELGELLFHHSTLKVENAKLKRDLHHYTLAATAEAELVDELRKENEALRSAIRKLHAAKGRYHTQLAACDLFDMVGLPNERPKT